MKYILFFCLFFSILNSSTIEGDNAFRKGNYIEAIKYYKQLENKNNTIVNQKILHSYIYAADHFSYIYNFKEAKSYYKKALSIDEQLVKPKLATLYEKEGDLYNKGKKFELALDSYKKSLHYGNENVSSKIKDLKMFIEHQKNLTNDSRKIVNSKSPKWTKAIGRLIIPTKIKMATKNGFKANIKKCSATLVSFEQLEESRIIVTASHCLSEYDKSVGLLRFVIKNKRNKTIQKYATIYKDSNFDPKLKKRSDYAILILSSSITKKDIEAVNVIEKSFMSLEQEYKYHFGSLAGFSSDIGDYGSVLTYDPKCKINYYNKLYAKSHCSGFKGASGGPVILTVSYDKKKVEFYFIGVISHFRGKKYNEIFFAPHHIFYKRLKKAIDTYNQ